MPIDSRSSPQRIAVIGCGYWGKNLVRTFHSLGVLKTVCDASQASLDHLESTYPGVVRTRSYLDVLEDPEIEAVAIATPAATHREVACRCLEAGKHVFVEKPMALTEEDANAMVGLARSKKLRLMVGHVLRYHPAVETLLAMVKRGEFGKIQYIASHRMNFGKIRHEENALWSFAPHDVSVILGLMGEMPRSVSCHGGAFVNQNVADVTASHLEFPSGVHAHLFVSWLHPFKEQKLVVVGDRKMAVFDDVEPERKLMVYDHQVSWENRMPVARKSDGTPVAFAMEEPLLRECRTFLGAVDSGVDAVTDGEEGLRVLKTLMACQRSLETGAAVKIGGPSAPAFSAHESSYVDDGVEIGQGTKIWHFSHVMPGSRIGRDCRIGQNVTIGPNAIVGDGVKIQNNVSVYEGVELENEVFCGPSVVFTNVINPRSHIVRRDEFKPTLVKRRATLGANSTIICGHTIGEYAFVAAGAVVTKDVPAYALVAGSPARRIGWMSRSGHRLPDADDQGVTVCPATGERYQIAEGIMTLESQ